MTNTEQPYDESAALSANRASHPQSPTSPLNPGSALLFASFSLGIGAYIGYRRALHESQSSSLAAPSLSNVHNGIKGNSSILGQLMHPEPPLISSSTDNGMSLPGNSKRPPPLPRPHHTLPSYTTPPPILAARALAIGSLLSLSGTALLLSGIFFASGCQSIEEFISSVQVWAPNQLHQFEKSLEKCLGISSVGKERRAAKLEYERDVKGMTEEEELDYVKRKYTREWNWDEENDDAGKGQH
jgi:hypothetical protein